MPAKRSCTGLTEPELVSQGEEGLQTQLPGVQVAVWLDLAEPTPERFWKGAVLVIIPVNQPIGSQSKHKYIKDSKVAREII